MRKIKSFSCNFNCASQLVSQKNFSCSLRTPRAFLHSHQHDCSAKRFPSSWKLIRMWNFAVLPNVRWKCCWKRGREGDVATPLPQTRWRKALILQAMVKGKKEKPFFGSPQRCACVRASFSNAFHKCEKHKITFLRQSTRNLHWIQTRFHLL